MGRVKTGREKRGGKCCLTCLIVSIVILIMFVGGLFLGANIAFNKLVSPHIGGVTLMETLSLLRGLYRTDRNAIIAEEFGEADLYSFYDNLNTALFQQPYTTEENLAINQAKYDALTEEEQKDMSEEEKLAFLSQVNYRITIKNILDAVNFDDMVSGGREDEEEAQLAAAEDSDTMTQLLKQFLFDFGTLAAYNENIEGSEINIPFETLTITGKQTAAIINEIAMLFLEGESSPLKEIEMLSSVDNINNYIKIPQVRISYDKTLEESDSFEEYEKGVKFSITVEVKLRDAVDMALAGLKDELASIPPFALDIVKRIVPKEFFLTVGTYPLDNEKEVYAIVNNFDEKQVTTMNTILDAVVFSKMQNNDNDTSFLQSINSTIADVFSKIKSQNIALDFVSDDNTSGLQIRHIETLLNMMGLVDSSDPYNLNTPGIINSITPHMFLSAMKCLTVSYKESDDDYDLVAKNHTQNDLDLFLLLFERNYGINEGYLSSSDVNILDSSTLQNLSNNISLADNIDYSLSVKEMQVELLDIGLAALLSDAIASGLLDKKEGLAAAEDSLDLASFINFNQINISKKSETLLQNPVFNVGTHNEFALAVATKRIYELRLVLSINVADLLASNANDNSELIDKVFGSLGSIFFNVSMYIEEIGDADNNIIYSRIVGGEINPAQFRVNKFDYDNTEKVIKTLSLMMQKLKKDESAEEKNIFDISTISEKLEEVFETVFSKFEESLKASLRLDDKMIVLPSIYEVISGMVNDKAVVDEDKMDAEEVYGVFRGIYDSGIEVVPFGGDASPQAIYVLERYNENVSNAFLSSLSNNYYMKEQMDTSLLFDSEQISTMLSADSIDFVGEDGLYRDKRHIDALSIPMTGDALAALLVDSGKLESINDSGGLLQKLEIINATLRADNTSLYIDFELVAFLIKNGDSEEGQSNMSGFLPDLMYLTASVLAYSDLYVLESPRFCTKVFVNKMESEDNNNLFKLIRLLTGEEIDTSSITEEVKNAIEKAFFSLEENINLQYYIELTAEDDDYVKVKDALNSTYGEDTAAEIINTILLSNIFNTLNKFSNKTDPLYISDWQDDILLRERLKEFGRTPEAMFDAENEVGIKYFDNLFELGDSNAFIDNFNRFYYIDQKNRMEADGLLSNDGFFATSTSSADSFNFKSMDYENYPGLYLDTLAFSIEDFSVRMEDKALAELVFLGSGEKDPETNVRNNHISLGEEGDYAIITQIKIYCYDDQTLVMISMQVFFSSASTSEGDILPEFVFVTVIADLDFIINDLDNMTGEDLVLIINGMSEEETNDFFARIDKLGEALGFDTSSINQSTLKENAADAIKDGFRELSKVENITYGEDAEGGYLRLPDVFTYLVNHCDMKEASTDEKTTSSELCYRMREFGRSPYKEGEIIEGITYYTLADIAQFEPDAAFDKEEADLFFVDFNRNFYLSKDKQITTAASFFSGNFQIGESSFNFNSSFLVNEIVYEGLYIDSRPYSELETRLTQKQLGSLIKQKEEAFIVGDEGGTPDIAEIVQFGIIFDSVSNQYFLKTLILYSPTTQGNSLPDYLFITSYTNLDEVDEFGEKLYSTYILVNDLDKNETSRFFDNMTALQATLNLSSNVDKAVIESTISNKFKDIFESQLAPIGHLEWKEGYIKLPNMFEYIVSGDKINEGEGMFDFVVDASGNKIEDSSNTTGYQTTATTPETLMLRLRGFGKLLAEGQPIYAEGNLIYNDNLYILGDDTYFYEMLQQYYYLKDTPDSTKIYNGTLFDNIDDTTFIFEGDTTNYSNDKPNYYGLYNYCGEQQKARLSDRALAAILATDGSNPSTAGMNIQIETLKIYFVEGKLVFEITSKAMFDFAQNDALPEYVYLTSFTVREEDGFGGWIYTTQVVANSFGVIGGNTINLSYNLSQMASYGVDFDVFDTDSLCDNISNMISNALASLGGDLNISYKEYNEEVTQLEEEEGIGYIEFKSIYGIIADMTLNVDTEDTTALTMQSMIVKLHEQQLYESLVTNPKSNDESGKDYSYDLSKISGFVTDKYFASMILPIEEDGIKIEIEQSLFVSAASDELTKTMWKELFDNAREESFDFETGQNYIIITGSLDLGGFATDKVSLLPDILYSSLIMDADSNSAFEPLLLFNKMNHNEMSLFLSIAKSDTANFDNLSENLKTRVKDTLDSGLTSLFGFEADGINFYPKDALFTECVGYLEVYKHI